MDVGVADSFVRKWVIFLQDIVILRKIKIHGIFGKFSERLLCVKTLEPGFHVHSDGPRGIDSSPVLFCFCSACSH